MNSSIFKITLLAGMLALSPAATADDAGDNLPDFGDSTGVLISPTQEFELGKEFMRSVMAQAPGRDVRPLMPRPRLADDGALVWEVIDARDGSVLISLPTEPAGSEVAGA